MNRFFEAYSLKSDVVAAAVSGGADSLALVLRLNDWAKAHQVKVIALTVDHQLRSESGAEAAYVAGVMKKHGIEHHILVWEGEKPQSDVEAVAREARYDLLCGWCHQHGVTTLAVGHHCRDQAETFLLRLQRGSGLYGLSGILPVTNRNGIEIIRPQLNDNPDDLKTYLRDKQIEWVEDPSNQCEDYQRVRMRKFLALLEQGTGISVQRLAETTAVLARTRAYFEDKIADLIANHVRWWQGAAVSVSRSVLLAQHEEIRYRLLSELIVRIGGRMYAPEAEEVLRLSRGLEKPDFKGCTLGHCELFESRNKLWIVPEDRSATLMTTAEWDKCLKSVPQYAKSNLPYKVRRAIYNQVMKQNNG